MTIAHLVIGGDVAGGQMVALQLARGAAARGDRVAFLTPGRGPFTELVEQHGFAVLDVDVARTYRIGGAVRLARLLRRERVDVLHTHTALAANVLSRVAGRVAGVAVVSHLHIENHFRANRVIRAIHRMLDNNTARLATRVLAVSDETRTALVTQGYPPELVEVVHNGIDVEAESARVGQGLREELGVANGALLVGEVARLCDVKGQRELIDALALVPGAHAVLVGDDIEQHGAYRELLESLAQARGVAERTHMLGYRDDAGAVIDQLDALVLPSWIEGFPMVVLEAMAHAKPVVATSVGGTPEAVVDGVTGVLVRPQDIGELAAALGRLAADPEGSRQMGSAGRERVEREFSESAMVRRVLEVYDAVA